MRVREVTCAEASLSFALLTFGLVVPMVAAALCTVGCLAASLSSTHQMPGVTPHAVVTIKIISRDLCFIFRKAAIFTAP